MLERDVEQGQEVFYRRCRRIPDFCDEGTYFAEEALLPLVALAPRRSSWHGLRRLQWRARDARFQA